MPVHFIQGKLDVVAPAEREASFYEHLQAPDKVSACLKLGHVPQYEESEKFSNIILSHFNQSKRIQ